MKAPKYPTKPYPPYKPEPPPPTVDENKAVGSCPIDTYTHYTIESLTELLKGAFTGDVDAVGNEVQFEFEVEKSWDYDDVTTSIVCNLITQRKVPNPRLVALTKDYHQAMTKYEKEYAKYKDALAQYNIDMPIYELEMNKYSLEQSKLNVKRLEKKLKIKQLKVKK